MSTLKIQLLGSFQLKCGNKKVVELRTARQQTLLAYLVLHCGNRISREHLAFLMWPDSTENQARANLRFLLHQLRRLLPESDRFIHADSQTVEWIPRGPYQLDVAEFKRALVESYQAQQAEDLIRQRTRLEHAITLYQGDLLPACYEDWILAEREQLHHALVEALETLVRLLESQADFRNALTYANQLLRNDPLREETYRHLMRLHMALGNRGDVLRVYQTCVSVLKRELDVEPNPATRAVFKEMMEVKEEPITPAQPAVDQTKFHNLPVSLTKFIGREREKAAIKRFMKPHSNFENLPSDPEDWLSNIKSGQDQDVRLLTLTGPGGSGKTRLALETTRELATEQSYKDGIWWVELASLSDAVQLPYEITRVLGIREQAGQTPSKTLSHFLQNKQLLLILDNCEHLVETCSQQVKSLLYACPDLHILATSREPLNIEGEVILQVLSLSLPDSTQPISREKLLQYDAIRLFVDRALSSYPTFRLTSQNASSVIQVCQRLDGMPLAIELAAARAKVLTVEQIASRLDNLFSLLSTGNRTVLPRHQTLQAAIEWSFNLLSIQEQTLFCRLCVFRGSFGMSAVEIICAGDGIDPKQILDLLSCLIDKSLVVRLNQDGDARYKLLDTIREFGRHRLTAEQQAIIWQRHAVYFLELAEQAKPLLENMNQLTLLDQLEQEHDNLRAAHAWLIMDKQVEQCLRLGSALWLFWVIRGFLTEGREQLSAILELTKNTARQAEHAEALNLAGLLARYQGDYPAALKYIGESLAIRQELGERNEIADSSANLGFVLLQQGDYPRSYSMYTQCLDIYKLLENQQGIADAKSHLGLIAFYQGDYSTAVSMTEESLAIWQELGDQQGIVWALHRLGYILLRQKYENEARQCFVESLQLAQKLGYRWGIASSLEDFASLAAAQGRAELSVQWAAAAQAIRDELNMPLPPPERAGLEGMLQPLKETLGQAAFDELWRKGRSISLEKAITWALAE